MSNIKVTFLGTGTSQGVPMIACNCEVCLSSDPRDKRLRSSVLIETDEVNFVIDTGPDFRYQMLREKVTKLDAVLYTHEHKDHIAGLDDIRGFNYWMKKPMDIYATEQVQFALKREFHYAFETNKYPGVPQLNLKTIENSPFDMGNLKIIPIQLTHYKMPVFGYRIGKFAYITDANNITDEELEKLKGVEVLVINALRKTKHISHFTLKEALAIIEKINPKRAFLTHFSHQMGKYVDVVKELPENVLPAHDRLVIEIN